MTELARAADIVLPGAAWVEKDATYTNDQGRVQGAAQVFAPPGEAREDCDIFLAVAQALRARCRSRQSAEVRLALARALAGNRRTRRSRTWRSRAR